MRKFMTYFFIVAYLFSFPEARQVIKLPNLVEHYISHKLRNPNMSVFSFIKIHYVDEQLMDSDYDQDMKLPFKTNDYGSHIFSLTIPPRTLEIASERKKIVIKSPRVFHYSNGYSNDFLYSFFRPPESLEG
ncbi:hypothetical protein [Bergeyella sp. RCAD1439]|uniref:hypothetical protein n=1 Tax=Bergeyella anatis TaxID=3113737 RepID=UPI002E1762E0|nr:hypothetical protein [Bergeyella sp. RCAD1439]